MEDDQSKKCCLTAGPSYVNKCSLPTTKRLNTEIQHYYTVVHLSPFSSCQTKYDHLSSIKEQPKKIFFSSFFILYPYLTEERLRPRKNKDRYSKNYKTDTTNRIRKFLMQEKTI